MKKKIALSFVVVLLLITLISLIVVTISRPQSNRITNEDKNNYDTLVKRIKSQTEFLAQSQYFNLSTEMVQLDDGTYHAFIRLNSPRVGMFNVGMIALDADVETQLNDPYRHSIGVIGTTSYHIIPGQVDNEINYVQDIQLELISEKPEMNVLIFVKWQNELGDVKYEQFIKKEIKLVLPQPEEVPVEVTPEQP